VKIDSWDTKGTCVTPFLRYFYSENWRGMIAARCHTVPQLIQIPAKVCVEVFKTLPVNPSTSPVSLHLLVSIEHLTFSDWKRFRLAAWAHPNRWLAHSARLDNAIPSLQYHYNTFNTTTDDSAPVIRIGTLILVGSPLGFLPWQRNDRFSSSVRKPAYKSCHLYAGCRLDSKRAPSRPIPATLQPTGFDNILPLFDTSSMVHSRSSLVCTPDMICCHTFSLTLTTMTLYHSSLRWFETYALTSIPRGLPSSFVQLRTAYAVLLTHWNAAELAPLQRHVSA
jgi:hypothetical protein